MQLRGKGTDGAANSVSWGLLTFTVQSPLDLDAMRTALSDSIDYFEAGENSRPGSPS